MTLDEEIVIALGEFSLNLLRDPKFKVLNDLFEQQVAADVLSTKPEEKQKREYLYATLQGGRAFMGQLQLFAEKYTQLTSTTQVEDAIEDDIDDPSVHDF